MTTQDIIPSHFQWWIKAAKGLIFDCDGTLVDSMPVHFLAWHQTMTRYGLILPEDRFYALGGMPSHRIIEMLAREQSVTIDIDKAAMEKEKAFLDRIHLLEPIHSVLDVAMNHRTVRSPFQYDRRPNFILQLHHCRPHPP